ncbi:EamA family transporter RarD [Candidatus Pelagibacter sp. Uisw_099_02]|uniref:EamA family transporter RarD n=1 Tax=Candidatus Pelagibacter sp. Uisw_099_02 TaxID=3230981 RepID=UPI0039E8C330
MKNQNFNKGITLTALGSFWWGVIGVIYFKYISFVGPIEVVIHRCVWTSVVLIISTFYFSKWNIFFEIISNKKKLIWLFFSGFLIFINWATWIYAVGTERIIDASFGYFIMPILSVFLGYIFYGEKINKKRGLSIVLVLISILFLLFLNFDGIPWVGIIVALSWGFYNLLRKKINVDTDVGLLVESLFIFPFALISFFLIFQNNLNDFSLSNPPLMLILMLAGPMTVIPLFMYVRGVELCGLGPTGMIFYITPTFQFLLGFFYYNEPFSFEKSLSFILIWIAVVIYLKDLYEKN